MFWLSCDQASEQILSQFSGVRQENSALRVEVETMRNQMTEINTSQLNRDGDMTKLRVERDRISAEKSGLELVLRQKDDELAGMTKGSGQN